MAIIPRFDGRIGQQLDTGSAVPAGNLYTPPARTSSMEAVGAGITQAAFGVGKIFQAQREREAANYTTKTSAAIQEHVIRSMNESKQRALETGNVEGFTQDFLQGYDKVVSDAIEKAPNELAREDLTGRMAQARNSLLGQAMKFEADTRVAIYKHNLDTAADSYAKAAALDPEQIPQILKQMGGDIEAAKHTLGLADAEERLAAYKNQIVATAVSHQIKDNPYQANNLIQRYQSDLNAKDFVALSRVAAREQQRIEKKALRAQKEAAEIASVWGAVNGGIPLNPASPSDRSAVDKFYATMKASDPDADFSEIAIRTNIMPQAMKQELSGKLASGTVEQKVEAAQQLKVLHEEAPSLVAQMSKSDKAKATLIASYIGAGIDASRAVEWAEKDLSKKDDAVLKQRDRAAAKEEELKFASIESEFTGLFGGGVEAIPDEMRADYELLARAYYVDAGVPADMARTNALNDLRANWYKSNITGRARYMKNAPEVVFKNAAGSEWIAQQFKEEYGTQFNGFEKFENLILQPNPVLTRDKLPVYNIYRIDEETGMVDAVFDKNGAPLLFQPDFEKSSLYKELINSYEGETFEEKKARYLQETEAMQLKQLTRGQEPDFMPISQEVSRAILRGF